MSAIIAKARKRAFDGIRETMTAENASAFRVALSLAKDEKIDDKTVRQHLLVQGRVMTANAEKLERMVKAIENV